MKGTPLIALAFGIIIVVSVIFYGRFIDKSMIGDMGLLYFPDSPPIALTIMIEDPEHAELADEEIGQLKKIIVDSIAAQIR